MDQVTPLLQTYNHLLKKIFWTLNSIPPIYLFMPLSDNCDYSNFVVGSDIMYSSIVFFY